MKGLIAVLIMLTGLATHAYAEELATESGLFVGLKYQDEQFMPREPDAKPMHIRNTGVALGYQYEPTVTRIEVQGYYTKLQIKDAVMPGMSLRDEKLSGIGIDFTQGFRVSQWGDLRAGGFVQYVYHLGLFGQEVVIPTEAGEHRQRIDIPRFHQLRTGGVLQARPFEALTVRASGGYQLQGKFVGVGGTLRLGKFGLSTEYFHGLNDRYGSYTVSATVHF